MAIARVTQTGDFASGAATSIGATAFSLTSGNLVVVQVRTAGSSHSSVTDTAGNTYTKAFGPPASGLGTVFSVWYSFTTAGNASNVVTANFGSSIGSRGILTAQYSGVSGLSLIAAGGGAFAGFLSSNPMGKVVTSTGLIVAGYSVDTTGSTWVAGTGFTTVVSDASTVQMMQEAIVAASTTYDVDGNTSPTTTSKNGGWMFFNTASGGGGGGTGGSFTFVG